MSLAMEGLFAVTLEVMEESEALGVTETTAEASLSPVIISAVTM